MRLNPFRKPKKKTYRLGRPRFAVRMGRFVLRVFLLVVAAAAVTGLVWLGLVTHRFVTESEYFAVKKIVVTVSPREESVVRQVEEKIGVEKVRGHNLLLLRTEDVRRALESIPKVRCAAVVKRYPATLSISVTAREMAALLVHDPILAVDGEGVIIESVSARDPRALRYPFISGVAAGSLPLGTKIQSEALTRVLALVSCWEQRAQGLYRKMSEIHCDPDEQITVLLKGGTEVRFGTGNPIRRMPDLDTFLEEKGPPEGFAYIDLRIDGQVTYKPKQAAGGKPTSPRP